MTQIITTLSTMIVGILAGYLGRVEFLSENPDLMQGIILSLTSAIGILASLATSWLGNSPKWERILRLIAMVVNLVRTEATGAETNQELRKRAIDLILQEIPTSNLGWRGTLFRVPGLGQWVLGILLDRLVSGYRRLAGEQPDAPSLEIRKGIDWVKSLP